MKLSVKNLRNFMLLFMFWASISHADICSRSAVVVTALEKLTTKTCQDIARDDLLKLTVLRLRSQPLVLDSKDFQDLENLKVLTVIDCDLTELTSDDFFKTVPNLEFLDLSHNKIEKVSENTLAPLKKLKTLAMNGNLIKELPEGFFAQQSELKTFSFDGNGLANLPLKLFNSTIFLESLSMNNNNIEQISEDQFIANKALKVLLFASNKLNNFKLNSAADLVQLSVLLLDGNPITNESDLSLENYSVLKYVGLRDTLLNEQSKSNLTQKFSQIYFDFNQ